MGRRKRNRELSRPLINCIFIVFPKPEIKKQDDFFNPHNLKIIKYLINIFSGFVAFVTAILSLLFVYIKLLDALDIITIDYTLFFDLLSRMAHLIKYCSYYT
jgi:hypothetical protein